MRRQPPVYSPVSASQIVGAAGAAARWGDRERAALADELRDRFAADEAILTASGTHALQLALRAVPTVGRRGRVVALPGYSCFDLVTAAVAADAGVRFYDVDPLSLAPDIDSVRRVLREGVSAVVAANLYGYPLDWGTLEAVTDAAGVPLIEDAAQGIGTRTDRGAGGALGAATVLSFGRGKGWTGGGGGALLFRGERADWIERAELEEIRTVEEARAGLVTMAAWGLGRPLLYWIPTSIPALGLGETHYREPTRARSISSFCAALARRTARPALQAIGARRRTAGRLKSRIEEASGERSGVRVCEPCGGAEAATFLRLPAIAGTPGRKREVLRVGRDLGVASGYPTPLHRLPQSRLVATGDAPKLPGSDALAQSLVTLPAHRWVGTREEAAIVRLFVDPTP